ncbi:SERTA domain-containing protein 4-like [Kryptolebias marmoratus]|uniref:SERTA domain containing 4 n=1 Tax=Kryptolebias marmoratus TaxID=37003 RepID=A0A3Q3ACU4_KRYMA|nr:SERTA domain-containing protein 4-like [Kryptolebias marmoratus]
MTLVLSMNPFLDSDGDPPPIWDSERCRKTGLSNPDPACSSDQQQFAQEPPCRRVPDHVSVSKITYFKRKFVDDDEESHFSFRTYCQTVAPVLEERAHVLRLSLEKMRFIDDPEAFLRRSVLVNNLLRRLRAEILLQSSDWCFPPNPPFAGGPCILPPAAGPAHRAVPARICLAAPQAGPPLRKRFRMVRGVQGDFHPECCCIYAAAAAAGHYLHLPFSVYDSTLSTCPATPHTSFFQLAGHSKLGLTVAVGDHEEEEEDAEEEEENEEVEDGDERRQEGPSVDAEDKLNQKTRTRTSFGHKHLRTEDSGGVSGSVEEEQEEEEDGEEEEEPVARLCPWDSETDVHRFSFWQSKAHRQ